MNDRLDWIRAVAAAALERFDETMGLLGLGGGKRSGDEYLVHNPVRDDKHRGSLSINVRTGKGGDFALDGEWKWGDLVGAAAVIWGCSNGEAADRLGQLLGLGSAPTRAGRQGAEQRRDRAIVPKVSAKEQGSPWVPAMPVPDSAPPPPAAHPHRGLPETVWTYRDADGADIGRVYRFVTSTGGKEVLPLVWAVHADSGRAEWRWMQWREPRPLYGLDRLAGQPDAPVLVVEGEKCADAAADVLAGFAVVSWSGGGKAVDKADWTPLLGRDVWIWPDCDAQRELLTKDEAATGMSPADKPLLAVESQPGMRAALRIAEILRPLAGSVSLVEIPAPGEVAGGWDVADAVAEGWSAEKIEAFVRNARPAAVASAVVQTSDRLPAPESTMSDGDVEPLIGATKKRKRSPPAAKGADVAAPATTTGFELRADGVFFLKEGSLPQFVCGALDIVALVRDRRGDGWGRLVEFHDHDARLRREIIDDRMLEGDGTALTGQLRSWGLYIGHGKAGLVKMYLNSRRPVARARRTGRIGWHHDITDPDILTYVMPGDLPAIAPPGAEPWVFELQGDGIAKFSQRGTLGEWRDQVAALAPGNSRLVFALSAGFAAGLIWLSPDIDGGFDWAGPSSIGKSGLLYAAASLCGAPEYRQTWNITGQNAAEVLAAGHTDAPLLLDELQQVSDPRQMGAIAYMFTQRQGKARAAAGGTGMREMATFRVLFQANGETTLARMMQAVGEKTFAGQEIRFIEIDGDAGAGMGCWEALHGHGDGAAFTSNLRLRAAKCYGTAYPAFLREVSARHAGLHDEFEAACRSFREAHLSNGAESQAIRVSVRFAAVGMAGELATQWGITGWQPGEAMKAAGRLFREWLRKWGGEQNLEPRMMVTQVRSFLQAHGALRFSDMRRSSETDPHVVRTAGRVGWRRLTKETEHLDPIDYVFEYLIYPASFKSEICAGLDHKRVAEVLHERGFIHQGKRADGRHHFQQQAREPGVGRPSWFYVVSSAIFEGDDDE